MFRLVRLFFRSAMPAALVAFSAIWLMCQSVFVMIRIPLPRGDLHLRADHQGWLLQHGDKQFATGPVFALHDRRPGASDWHDLLQDIHPRWLGSTCVYAVWQQSGVAGISHFRIVGIRHSVVVLLTAAGVGGMLYVETRRRRTVHTPTCNQT